MKDMELDPKLLGKHQLQDPESFMDDFSVVRLTSKHIQISTRHVDATGKHLPQMNSIFDISHHKEEIVPNLGSTTKFVLFVNDILYASQHFG